MNIKDNFYIYQFNDVNKLIQEQKHKRGWSPEHLLWHCNKT
jgi:hypothetical protein